MKAKWLFEKDTFEEDLQPLMDAVKNQGMEYKITEYIPFEADTLRYSCLFNEDDCVVVYGSLQLAQAIKRSCVWVPGIYCDLPKFECTHYYPKLNKFLLNSPYVMLPYGDLINQKEFLFNCLGNNDCLFVRPSSGFKIFTGKVIKKEEYEKDVEYLGFYDVEFDKIVVVAEPKNIDVEWRLVSVKQNIIASSQYRLDGKRELKEGCPQDVLNFGTEVAKTWEPEQAWTLDICRLKSGELKLLEIGSFGCAGLYHCDANAIIENVSALALEEWSSFRE